MERAELRGTGVPSPDDLFAAIDARLDSILSPARAAHSRGTAGMAAEICGRQGLDPARGRAAGIAHDICKELPRSEQRELAALYPEAAATSSVMVEKALHGPAAAALLARDYGVRDEGILEAVAFHTIGRVGMGALAVAVYCADKLEPGREGVDDAFRADCLGLAPARMLAEVIRRNVDWLASRGKAVAPETLVLYNSLADGASAT
jgi:predicted HD superfamily hydrolase involved in NAD metabolism